MGIEGSAGGINFAIRAGQLVGALRSGDACVGGEKIRARHEGFGLQVFELDGDRLILELAGDVVVGADRLISE